MNSIIENKKLLQIVLARKMDHNTHDIAYNMASMLCEDIYVFEEKYNQYFKNQEELKRANVFVKIEACGSGQILSTHSYPKNITIEELMKKEFLGQNIDLYIDHSDHRLDKKLNYRKFAI